MKRVISITFAIMILAVCVLSLSSCSFCLPFSHDYGEWIAGVPATCSSDGRKGHYECRRCGEYFDENKKYANPYEDDPKDVRAICFNPNGDVLNGNIYTEKIIDIMNAYSPIEYGIIE